MEHLRTLAMWAAKKLEALVAFKTVSPQAMLTLASSWIDEKEKPRLWLDILDDEGNPMFREFDAYEIAELQREPETQLTLTLLAANQEGPRIVPFFQQAISKMLDALVSEEQFIEFIKDCTCAWEPSILDNVGELLP